MRLQSAFEVYRKLKPGRSVASLRSAVEAWRARHVTMGHTEYADPLVEDATPMQVVVNHGRWMVLCQCNNGIVVPPREEGVQAICPSCGTVWTTLVWPGEEVGEGEVTAIVQALEERRFPPTQNWNPGETAADLRRENAERGHR
jgi:biotin carboxyl carrier protein